MMPMESPQSPAVLDGVYSGYDGLADAVSALVSAIVDGTQHYGKTYRVVVTEVKPSPDEPTGLGAVVKASVNWDSVRTEWVQAARLSVATPSWYRVGRAGSADWDQFIDPVVLSEGLIS